MSLPRDLPMATVVVPTYRRPERIARCVEAIAAQDYPDELLELVVVEDGGPTEQLESLRRREFGRLRVRFEGQHHSGPAAARNTGARSARGDVLLFTDDDCCPRPDWVARLVGALAPQAIQIVGGHTVNALEQNPYSRASQDLVTYITEYGLRKGVPFFASNNFAVSRELFFTCGGFDETFPLAGGEDREFSDRLAHASIEFIHEPTAVIDHYHHLTLRSFLRQHFRYGRGAYQYQCTRAARRGADLFSSLAQMPFDMDLRLYVDLIRYPFVNHSDGRWLTSALLLTSQVPNALGFFYEWLVRLHGSR